MILIDLTTVPRNVNIYISILSYCAYILSCLAFILSYCACIISSHAFILSYCACILSYRSFILSCCACILSCVYPITPCMYHITYPLVKTVYQVLNLSCIKFSFYQLLFLSCDSEYLGMFMHTQWITKRYPMLFSYCWVIKYCGHMFVVTIYICHLNRKRLILISRLLQSIKSNCLLNCIAFIPPVNEVQWGYIGITLSVRLSVRLSVFADSCPAHNYFLIWHCIWLTIFGTWVYPHEKMWHMYIHVPHLMLTIDLKIKFIGFCIVFIYDP